MSEFEKGILGDWKDVRNGKPLSFGPVNPKNGIGELKDDDYSPIAYRVMSSDSSKREIHVHLLASKIGQLLYDTGKRDIKLLSDRSMEITEYLKSSDRSAYPVVRNFRRK